MLLYLYLVILLAVFAALFFSFGYPNRVITYNHVLVILAIALVITNLTVLVGIEMWQTETVKEINDHGEVEMLILLSTGLIAILLVFSW